MNTRQHIKKNVALAVLLTVLLCISNVAYGVVPEDGKGQPKKQEEEMLQYVPGEVLVKFEEGQEPDAVLLPTGLKRKAIKRIHSIKPAVTKFKKKHVSMAGMAETQVFKEAYRQMSPKRKALYRKYKIKLDERVSVENAVRQLRKTPGIESAYPNYIRTIFFNAGNPDPMYGEQWPLPGIDAEGAWGYTEGNEDVVIAIIDTGIDYNHEDLADNIWRENGQNPGRDFVDINTAVYEAKGYTLFDGEDYITIDDDPLDYYGHGTHCAGIAAAAGDNGVGIYGVAHKCKIMPVRAGFALGSIFGDVGVLEDDDIAPAILYAVDNGADVISMSFGGSNPESDYNDEISLAREEGIILVAAAGNSYSSVENYPAALEGVIAVTATDENDEKPSFATYGDWVDIAAPGTYILSTVPAIGVLGNASGYALASGTSMACPHVAGLAALILSADPGLSATEVLSRIVTTADYIDDINPGYEGLLGSGRINASLACSGDVLISMTSPEDRGYVRGNAAEIFGSAYLETDFQRYEIYCIPKGDELRPEDIPIVASTVAVESGLLGTWNTGDLGENDEPLYPDGEYAVILKVFTTDGGELLPFSIDVTVDNVSEPPVFNLNNQCAVIGRLLELEIKAEDPDDPELPRGQLSYSASGLPGGATFADNGDNTATLSWTPSEFDKGIYTLTFTASDSDHTAYHSIALSTVVLEIDTFKTLSPYTSLEGLPSIYGDRITYADSLSGSVYMYEISSGQETLVAADPDDSHPTRYFSPIVDGEKIVWLYGYGMLGDGSGYIHVYDLDSGQIDILDSSYKVKQARVYGSKIAAFMLTPTGYEIALYNLSDWSETLLDITPENYITWSEGLGFYGDRVAWTENDDDFNYDIFLYDISEDQKTRLSVEGYRIRGSPMIHKDKVVWQAKRGSIGLYDIFVHDISSGETTQITENGLSCCPAIYEDRVVWQEYRTNNYEIYFRDTSDDTELQITDTPDRDEATPVIWGDKIVWIHKNTAGQYELTLAKLYFYPGVASVNPSTVWAPSLVTISGKNFGYEEGESYVGFNDGTRAAIQSWANDEIICMVPEDAPTGVLKVITLGGDSNAVDLIVAPVNNPPMFSPSTGDKEVYAGACVYGKRN